MKGFECNERVVEVSDVGRDLVEGDLVVTAWVQRKREAGRRVPIDRRKSHH